MFFASVAVAAWRDRRWSAAQFQRLQHSRLKELVHHARQSVPFYSERYKHIDPQRFEIDELPLVTKTDMLGAFAETVTGRAVSLSDAMLTAEQGDRDGYWVRGKYLVSVTGGTTGAVGYFLNDRRSWNRQSGYMMARTLRGRMGAASNLHPFLSGQRYRMAFIGTGHGASICTQIGTESPRIGRLLINRRVLSITGDHEKNVAELNRFQPRYMHGYSSYVERLARSQLAGELRIAPKFISLGSEAAPPALRAVVERAFPETRIVEQYGCSECPLLANQCPEGRMHINTDCCVIEPRDAQGRPVKPGELSDHILVTNLLNPFQPIIRYRVEDAVVISSDPCPCGRGLPMIQVHGRSVDTIWLRNNSGKFAPHSPLVFETLIHECAGFAQFQLIHERQNELRINFVPEPGCSPEPLVNQLRHSLDRYFRHEGYGNVLRWRIDPVQRIERHGTRKVSAVQSRVAPPGRNSESGKSRA